MNDIYTVGSEHRLGTCRYVVMPHSDEETVWLRLLDTSIETPISRMLLTDSLIDIGPIMDRQIDDYINEHYTVVELEVAVSLGLRSGT